MASSAGAVDAAATLSGASIIREIKASGIEFVVSVPDITTAAGILAPLEQETNPRLIRVCKEDEGVGICAGLAHTGKRALLLIQQTGMLDSINAIRGVAVEYSLPVVHDGRACSKRNLTCARASPSATACASSSRSSKPWASPITRSKSEADVAKIKPAIDEAYAKSQPVVLLIGRRPPRHDEPPRLRQGAGAPRHRRRHRAAGLFQRVRMAGRAAEPAQLHGARRHGACVLARSRACARAAGQARDRARRRRQPADEHRHAGDGGRGRAEEFLPFRLRERHLRGQRRPSDPEPGQRELRRASRAPPATAACTNSPTSRISSSRSARCWPSKGPCSSTSRSSAADRRSATTTASTAPRSGKNSRTPSARLEPHARRLVSRFGSSPEFSACSEANFRINANSRACTHKFPMSAVPPIATKEPTWIEVG